MKIEFAQENDYLQIENLSKMFAEENCCNGIIADNKNYFKQFITIAAKDKGMVVGYAYGKIETSKKNKSYLKFGEKLFYIEEMYIIPEKRNQGIGEKLFKFFEKYAKDNNVSIIELNAVSKNYNKLLRFYIEKLNMNFLSAYLYKKIY